MQPQRAQRGRAATEENALNALKCLKCLKFTKNLYRRASCKSHLLRHSGESRNPELLENPGFRVALRLPGMTTASGFQEFCKRLLSNFGANPLISQEKTLARLFGECGFPRWMFLERPLRDALGKSPPRDDSPRPLASGRRPNKKSAEREGAENFGNLKS